MVSGRSAGALAALFWVDYIATKVKNGKTWGLSDSGIFLDSFNIIYKRATHK